MLASFSLFQTGQRIVSLCSGAFSLSTMFSLGTLKVTSIGKPFPSATQSTGHSRPLIHYKNVSKSIVAFFKKHVCVQTEPRHRLFVVSHSVQVMISCQMLVQVCRATVLFSFCWQYIGSACSICVSKYHSVHFSAKAKERPVKPCCMSSESTGRLSTS